MCSQIERVCYNQNESIKSKIRNALGLKENECIIEGSNKGTYTIKPFVEGKELQINTIKSVGANGSRISLFQLCNLIFEHCIFACEIRLEGTDNEIEPPTDKKISKPDKTSPIDKKIEFIKCAFKKLVYFKKLSLEKGIVFRDTFFKNVASFDMVIFKSQTEFSNCIFQSEANFSNSTFSQKADFKQTIFNASAYFDQADFMRNADFERSEFCKNAHFYQTKFSQNPNFFQAMFNEHLNLTDTLIFNFDFEGLKGEVQTCSEADKFRDVFKNIKNALIKSGNLLGASRFRKMELYCKEIELDLKKKENRETGTRDFVDRIQLMFYRLTSDHHTDLLLILNNVIILIACFGAINFAFNLLSNNYFKVNSLTIGHAIGALIACSIFAILAICLIMGCCKKLLDYFNSNIDNIRLFLSKALPHKEQDTTCPRACVVFFSYITTAIILVVKPALLVPIFGQMIDSKSSIGFAFASLNIIYAILMFLLIFSLQKTARKNTIVPN